MNFYRKNRKAYTECNLNDKDTLGNACPFPFCNPKNTQKTLRQTETMYIMPNRVPYDLFEGCSVVDHLMVIPKRHVEAIGDFTDQEKSDQMTIIGEYEKQGYSTYARGVGSITRSVDHQHTHLIKLGGKRPKIFVYLMKPYFLFRR